MDVVSDESGWRCTHCTAHGMMEKDARTHVCKTVQVNTAVEPGDVVTVDMVNHPPHYNFGNIEIIDAIEDWGLSYHLGNTVKYVARAEHKGTLLEDLKKARWYLDRKIQLEEAKQGV